MTEILPAYEYYPSTYTMRLIKIKIGKRVRVPSGLIIRYIVRI
jgi:hypothetical protein